MSLSVGSATSKALFGPEQTNDSRPALITLALPETGAAKYSIPRLARIARSSAEPSSEIDEHSISIRGTFPPPADSNPPEPATTSFTSSQVDTMQNTMSHDASSL